jgi:hypothetical protein
MLEWFFIIYWSGVVLVAILIWITEFSSITFRNKEKSQWAKSKERVSNIYKNYDYESYRRPYKLK